MNKTLLALYGLKWNPFAPAVPATALHVGPRIDSFRRRVTYLAAEGGFALVTGEPGTGKSAALRILADHLAGQREVKVCMISRPQGLSRNPCSHIMSSRKASWLSLMNSINSPASVKSVWAANRVRDRSRSSPSRAIAAAAIDRIVPPRQ